MISESGTPSSHNTMLRIFCSFEGAASPLGRPRDMKVRRGRGGDSPGAAFGIILPGDGIG